MEIRIVRWRMTIRIETCGLRLQDIGVGKCVYNPISMAI